MSSGKTAGLDFQLYRYIPSLPAAAISVVVFGLLTIFHSWRCYRHRTAYFIPFVVGGLFETIGYAGRIAGHFDKEGLGGFIIQGILILVAPALFAASIYMILSRIVHTIGADELSPISPRLLTRIFVIGDIISFTIQGAGGGVQGGRKIELYKAGEKIIVAGLFLQIFFFGIFVAVAALFHWRALKRPVHRVQQTTCPWQRHMVVLYVTSALILVRSIIRVVEYLQGNAGYLISREVFIYIFDMLLMAIVMIVLVIWYVNGLVSIKESPVSKENEQQLDLRA